MEPQSAQLIKSAIRFFTKDEATFLTDPPSIVMGDPKEKRILTNDNYLGFVDLVKLACAMKDKNEKFIKIRVKRGATKGKWVGYATDKNGDKFYNLTELSK